MQAGEQTVRVEIVPPPRFAGELLVRVRRPGGLPPAMASIDGVPTAYDAEREAVCIAAASAPLRLSLEYD